MSSNQLILVQNGEFIPCDEVAYDSTGSAPYLLAVAALPINTMKATFVRLDNEIVPVPFIRGQERKAVTPRVRIDGEMATRIARAHGLALPPLATVGDSAP